MRTRQPLCPRAGSGVQATLLKSPTPGGLLSGTFRHRTPTSSLVGAAESWLSSDSSSTCSHRPLRTARHVLASDTYSSPLSIYPDSFHNCLPMGRIAGHLMQPRMSSGQDRAADKVTHHGSYCSTASPLSQTPDLDAMDSQDGLGADAGLGLSPSDQPQDSCLTILGLL